MDDDIKNDKLNATYAETLILQHENSFFTGGFCLSAMPLKNLLETRTTFLHPAEQLFFNKLEYPKRQHSYLLGRFCAKQAFLSIDNTQNPTLVRIENGVFMQPVLYYPHSNNFTQENLQVSISHTENMGAALIFPEAHPMSIDIESIDNDKNEVILEKLTNNEKEILSSFSRKTSLQSETFTGDSLLTVFLQVFWTSKEALSKVIKCGLTIPLELLEIDSMMQNENYFVSTFKNFYQYRAITFVVRDKVCSIVYPKKTKFELRILKGKQEIIDNVMQVEELERFSACEVSYEIHNLDLN